MPTFRNTLFHLHRRIIYADVSEHYLFHLHRPMKMEQIECSEMSAYIIQIIYSEHGESLKSRILILMLSCHLFMVELLDI